MKRLNVSLLFSGVLALSISSIVCASAQQTETQAAATVTQSPAPAPDVTQSMLNNAAADSRNFLATNVDYHQRRFYPAKDINRSNVKGLHVAWIFQTDIRELLGDVADRRQWRHVRHYVLRSRLCAQCADWRDVLALQARYGTDHDVLLRSE